MLVWHLNLLSMARLKNPESLTIHSSGLGGLVVSVLDLQAGYHGFESCSGWDNFQTISTPSSYSIATASMCLGCLVALKICTTTIHRLPSKDWSLYTELPDDLRFCWEHVRSCIFSSCSSCMQMQADYYYKPTFMWAITLLYSFCCSAFLFLACQLYYRFYMCVKNILHLLKINCLIWYSPLFQ